MAGRNGGVLKIAPQELMECHGYSSPVQPRLESRAKTVLLSDLQRDWGLADPGVALGLLWYEDFVLEFCSSGHRRCIAAPFLSHVIISLGLGCLSLSVGTYINFSTSRAKYILLPSCNPLPFFTVLFHLVTTSESTMCCGDLFLALLAVLFPPIAGMDQSSTSSLHRHLDSADFSAHAQYGLREACARPTP